MSETLDFEKLNRGGPFNGIIDDDFKKGGIMLLESYNMMETIELYQNLKDRGALSNKGRDQYWGMIEMAVNLGMEKNEEKI